MLPRHPWVEFYQLSIRGIARPGQRPWWAFWALVAIAQIPIALAQALRIILKVRPTAIIGFGGYGAFAPLFWGALLGIPLYIHEQNLFPGLVTRLFAPRARRVFLTYASTARWLRSRHSTVTGLPVRPEILSARPDPERFGLRTDKKTVLVFGGSRGSKALTEAAIAAHDECPDLQFLIVTGPTPLTPSPQGGGEFPLPLRERGKGGRSGAGGEVGVRCIPYIHEMGTALATADVVVCRAGAATLAELSVLNKPAIVIPWRGAAGDHQTANAKQLAKHFILLPESELTPGRLVQEIKAALHLKREAFISQRADALNHILREVLLDVTSSQNTSALYRDRRRRHEWAGQSLL